MTTAERKARRLVEGLGFVRCGDDETATEVARMAALQGVETVIAPPYGPHEGYEVRVKSRTPAKETS